MQSVCSMAERNCGRSCDVLYMWMMFDGYGTFSIYSMADCICSISIMYDIDQLSNDDRTTTFHRQVQHNEGYGYSALFSF